VIVHRDEEGFALLIDALGPYLDRVVIVGGWAHRLFRQHPLAQTVPYAPLMTRDVDVAIPVRMRPDEESLRERLLTRGFHEEFLGDYQPPVTHYHQSKPDSVFYVEFLTPLVGGEFRRDGKRDVTIPIAGISAQKLRHLGVLLTAPWSLSVDFGSVSRGVRISNPVAYIAQKLLIGGMRKQSERAKDVLYIHDTLELFGRSIPDLRAVWLDQVRPQLGQRSVARLHQTARTVFGEANDTVREAALMTSGRATPRSLVETCTVGLNHLFGSFENPINGLH
jgi:hypothetical protein